MHVCVHVSLHYNSLSAVLNVGIHWEDDGPGAPTLPSFPHSYYTDTEESVSVCVCVLGVGMLMHTHAPLHTHTQVL